MERITSTSNKSIREVRELIQKAKKRRENGLFVAEGERLISEIPTQDIVKVFKADRYKGKVPATVELVSIPDAVMDYLSDEKTSQGILAVVRQKKYKELQGDLILILETIQDPGNLGTIFRTALASGVTGILMNQACVDLYSPKVVRSTMGALFRMPFIITDDLPSAIQKLKSEGTTVYAAHLMDSKDYDVYDFTKKTAFMIGNEGNGLSDEISKLSDAYLKIPMLGNTESLNAAVATAVITFEAARQRRHAGQKH